MDRSEKDDMLERLMVQYGDELVRLAYAYVKNVEVAKDMVQNTFIKCYQHLHTFRFEAHIKTWLYRITINGCKDYLKSWHYKMVQVRGFIQDTAKSIMPSTEQLVLHKESNEELKETIFTLPTMYREVVYLYYYDSLTTEEIANVLQLSINTVKTRLRRAKQKLKVVIKEANVHEE